MSLRTVLANCARNELADHRPEVDDIVACAFKNHGDLLEAESKRLVWEAARRIVKELLREMASDEGNQLALPGLHLPSAIAVRRENGSVYYVRSDRATWPELLCGETERVDNVSAARRKLKVYREALERLRPLMQSRPELTVADALQQEKATA